MFVDDNWKIEADDLSVTLFVKKYRGEKSQNPGEPYWDAVSYHGSVKNALKSFLENEMLSTGFKDFKTLYDKICEVEGKINGLGKRIKEMKDIERNK